MLKKFLVSSLNKSYRKKEKETAFVVKSAENRLRETFVNIALSNLDKNKENFQEQNQRLKIGTFSQKLIQEFSS